MPSTFLACLHRLRRDTRGLAAVEAALIFPFLVALLMGMIELYFYMQADQRVETAAQLTADFIAQYNDVEASNQASFGTQDPSVSEALSIVDFEMEPLATTATNPTIDIASILYAVPTSGSNNLVTTNAAAGSVPCTPNPSGSACTGIDWEQPMQGATASATSSPVYTNFSTGCTVHNLTGCYCTLDPTTFSTAPACLPNQSVIYVQVQYTYTSPISWFLGRTRVITATAYLKPRSQSYVLICTAAGQQSCA
jgi:Flp pilus assembly protein TadG